MAALFAVLLDVSGGAVSSSQSRLPDDRVHRIPVQLRGARSGDQRALRELRVLS